MTSQKSAEEPAAEENTPESTAAVSAEASVENRLQEENDLLRQENARFRDQWVRAVAETDNVRKRSQRDLEEAAKYGIASFARDMAGVLENLKRASDSIPAGARENDALLNKLGEGVDLTLYELLNIFERYGIERIDPLDKKFDHNLHQAVAQVDRDDIPPGMVVQVVQAGYTLGDRLLMPAMVVVSRQGEPPKTVDETA